MRYLPLLVLAFTACATAPNPAPDPDVVSTPGGRIAARLVRPDHDPARHQATSKVFHHVYAPDGRLLTKGAGGQFGHHRGLFVGWNQMRWNSQRADFWHCSDGVSQQFRAFAEQTDGWQRCEIDWCTSRGECVLTEHRAIRARDLGDDVIVLELDVDLHAHVHPVRLAGDPQHAGQQFRALQAFAEDNGPKVEYIRPADATGHGNDVWKGCTWIAAVLPMAERDVTVLRVESAQNPRPTTWSTRAYGRFGATFDHTIPAAGHLACSWTYVIALGRRDASWCEELAAEIAQAPERISSIAR